jgi:transglutaminase-like putative cysteine protease
MTRLRTDWAGVVLPAALAAFTTWVALWSWAGFLAGPSRLLAAVLVVAVLVATAGIGLRLLRVPAPLVLLGQVGTVVAWLTHRWAPDEALWGWLPTQASLQHGVALLRDGVLAAQTYAAPVPISVPHLVPLLVAAAALVAVLVDLLACGLRRVPVAGLPLLAVYTAPVSILGGVPWWVFAAGAGGFLALLATDEGRRLAHWGRSVSQDGSLLDTGDGPARMTSLRLSAHRIGLTAMTLAVVSPLVVPTLGTSLLAGSGTGAGRGGDSVTLTNPMVNLRRDLVRGRDVDLLTVTTADADPSYLRISVLDTFDNEAWKPSDREIPPEHRADGPLPRPPGLDPEVARRQVGYRIRVEDAFDSTWLPTPYPVTSIEAPGDWRYDPDTFDFISAADDQDTRGIEYSLTALEVTPGSRDLLDAGPAPESVFTPYTDLPEELPGFVATLAREVTAGRDTRFEKAVRLQRWFREDGGFEYSLEQDPGTGADDLQRFLSPGPGGRIGYCEQFAASMALMGRTLGIPSRMAVGFLRPDKIGGGEYVYSAHDLHAWPEMYFDGVGWVRFEPTPSDRASGVPGYTIGSLDASPPTADPSTSAPTSSPQDRDRSRLEGDPAVTGATGSGSGGGGVSRTLLLGLVALLLLVGPGSARVVVRRRRWATARTTGAAAETGWRELRDAALDLRLPWDDTRTLRSAARALATRFGPGRGRPEGSLRPGARGAAANLEAAQALERVVQDVELARYARDASAHRGRTMAEVRADVAVCTEALHAGAVRRHRRLAAWLPASLVRHGSWRSLLPQASAVSSSEAGVDRAV